MKRIFTVSAVFIIVLSFGVLTFSQQFHHSKLDKLSSSLWEMVNNFKSHPLAKSNAMQPSGVSTEGENIYSVIISTDNVTELEELGININSKLKEFVTARVTLSELLKMIELNSVKNIRPGEILYPHNDVAAANVGADLLKSGYAGSTIYNGNGVLTCIIDTGIDWTHPDFRDSADQTKSRILYVWDQTITKIGAEQTPQDRDGVNFLGLNYGVEYTKVNIEDEIDGSPAGFVREHDTNGHGTHVAGTVAGNGAALSNIKYQGMAPKADIIFIKAGNGSFSSTNIIDALSYAQKIATQLGKPIVVNMSLGGQGNAHDGTSDQDIAVENFVGPGRIAVISAGNNGADAIHITGTVLNGATANINFTVPSYTPAGGSENDVLSFDLWFDTPGNVDATVTTPNIQSATQNTNTQGTTETSDGSVYLYNFVDGNNSDREVLLYADDNNSAVPPAQGTWTLAVTNNSGGSMTYHGWLYTTTIGATLTGGNSQYTIGSPGTAASAITVGSYVTRNYWHTPNGVNYAYVPNHTEDISTFSSIGPRRDGVQKPDIIAPGQAIVSCTSSDITQALGDTIVAGMYHKNQGTSMSAPVTAGCVALLLQQSPTLTPAQVKTYLTGNANTDTYTGAVPNATWGYGKLNIFASMSKLLNAGNPTSREIIAYDQWASFNGVGIPAGFKVAVRFTPTFNGKITGLLFHIYQANNITSNLFAEIWSDNGSNFPNVKLGSTVTFPTSGILGNSWNFINMQPSGISVTSGTNYHAVLYWSTASSITAIAIDNSTLDGRSSFNGGASWSAYPNDFRMRAINTISNVSILPVELAAFNASVFEKNVKLSWQTTSEVNNLGFEIERNQSQKSGVRSQESEEQGWEKIGFVEGHGNANSNQNYSFTDGSANLNGKISYRLKQIDNTGEYKYSDVIEVSVLPVEFAIEQNYPNPFNPSTTINYSLPEDSKVKITLFNMLGEKVSDIIDLVQAAGYQQAVFNASSLSSGVYYYRIEAKGINDQKSFDSVKKMMVLK